MCIRDSLKIDNILSADYETKVKINKREFLSCIDRSTLLVKEADKKPIILDIKDDVMELKMNSIVGSLDEEIDIVKNGKDLMIGFDPKFLIDALKVIDDEDIEIKLLNPKAPCFIKDEQESYISVSYTHLVITAIPIHTAVMTFFLPFIMVTIAVSPCRLFYIRSFLIFHVVIGFNSHHDSPLCISQSVI